MNIRLKKIFFIGIGIYLAYNAISLAISFIYVYKVDFKGYNKYLNLFNESYVEKIDTLFCVGDYRKSDSYYTYLCGYYYVGIIEIYDINDIELESIKLNENVKLNNIIYYPSFKLNNEKSFFPEILNYWKMTFNGHMEINLNEDCRIFESFKKENYFGFIGDVSKMTFSNEKGKHLMQIDYRGFNQRTLFVIWRRNCKNYIIMVNSNKDFGIEVLNLFDLPS